MAWIDRSNDFWIPDRGSTDDDIVYCALHFCECHGWRKFGYPFENYTLEQMFNIASVEWTDAPRPRVDLSLPSYVQEHQIIGEISRANRERAPKHYNKIDPLWWLILWLIAIAVLIFLIM
jgi:hypothetical protein